MNKCTEVTFSFCLSVSTEEVFSLTALETLLSLSACCCNHDQNSLLYSFTSY